MLFKCRSSFFLILVILFGCCSSTLTSKTPSVKGITWQEAEKTAKDSAFAYFAREDLSFDSVSLEPCAFVRSLDLHINNFYMFLIEAAGQDTSLHGKIFVDSLSGKVVPFSVGFFPIHPVSPTKFSYYDLSWPKKVFHKTYPGKAPLIVWSLISVGYNTQGFSIFGQKRYAIRGGWEFPVWWGTDADGNDYFVSSNAVVHEIFDLDPAAKKRNRHPLKKKSKT